MPDERTARDRVDARIVRRRDVTAEVFVIWLEPSVPFTFLPGQYITIGIEGVERPYSIVSAPSEPLVELVIEYVSPTAGGRLTATLHRLRVGDRVTMRRRARGRFLLRAGVRHHVMIATGTGIAPYMSMIRQFVADRRGHPSDGAGCRFFVLYGASYQDELVYADELGGLSRQCPDTIQLLASVSRPGDARNRGWQGPSGRVNELVPGYLERWRLAPTDATLYVCGHPGMIADVRARFEPQGWVIAEEGYWRG